MFEFVETIYTSALSKMWRQASIKVKGKYDKESIKYAGMKVCNGASATLPE